MAENPVTRKEFKKQVERLWASIREIGGQATLAAEERQRIQRRIDYLNQRLERLDKEFNKQVDRLSGAVIEIAQAHCLDGLADSKRMEALERRLERLGERFSYWQIWLERNALAGDPLRTHSAKTILYDLAAALKPEPAEEKADCCPDWRNYFGSGTGPQHCAKRGCDTFCAGDKAQCEDESEATELCNCYIDCSKYRDSTKVGGCEMLGRAVSCRGNPKKCDAESDAPTEEQRQKAIADDVAAGRALTRSVVPEGPVLCDKRFRLDAKGRLPITYCRVGEDNELVRVVVMGLPQAAKGGEGDEPTA